MRSLGCALIQYDSCPWKEEIKTETDMPRGKVMWRNTGGTQTSTNQEERQGKGPSLTAV